jgi:hypothetical protein
MSPPRRRAPDPAAVRAVSASHMADRRALADRAESMAASVDDDGMSHAEVVARAQQWFRELAADLRQEPARRGRPT